MKIRAESKNALPPLLALLAGLSWFAAAEPAAHSPVREIVVVFKTHYDIGYTDLVTNILTRYRTHVHGQGAVGD